MQIKPVRKNIRLKDFDYSSCAMYFITICTKDRQKLLWGNETVGARIARPLNNSETPELSNIGKIVQTAIENISDIYETITVEKYVIMPNHLHIILIFGPSEGRAMRAPTVGSVINQLKGYVTKQIGRSIWQKLFYDHIIRDENDFSVKWQYIDTNPFKWIDDKYYEI